jgi:hypothetical protein
MVTNPAPLILALLTSIAVTVWLIGAYYLANSPAIAARRERGEEGAATSGLGFEPGPTTIVGGGEIEGTPPDNSRKLAAVIARDGLGAGQPLQIVERRDDRIVFISPGDPLKPRGEIQLGTSGSERTRFDYCVEYDALSRPLKVGWMILAVALIVLAIAVWVVRTYLVPSRSPGIWGQSIQLIQMVHLLWPPFLLGSQYRSRYRSLRRRLDTALHNLPYHAD